MGTAKSIHVIFYRHKKRPPKRPFFLAYATFNKFKLELAFIRGLVFFAQPALGMACMCAAKSFHVTSLHAQKKACEGTFLFSLRYF